MSNKPFIRAMEVWVPTEDHLKLELSSSYYDPSCGLTSECKDKSVSYGENLPGQAWSDGQPVIMNNLADSDFKYCNAALAAGLTYGLAIPFYSEEKLNAVFVIYCGDHGEHVGAIETWHMESDGREMELVDGYFGTAAMFEFASRHIKFRCGFGLPGVVWHTGMPLIINDLGRTKRFVRSHTAMKAGILRGVGIPCGKDQSDPWVLTLLSSRDTPIASRFECWITHPHYNSSLSFQSGICDKQGDLYEMYGGLIINAEESFLGQALRSKVPVVTSEITSEPELISSSLQEIDASLMTAVPVISEGRVKAVVAWYL